MQNNANKLLFPYLIMVIAPCLFSTNLIFGRYVAPQTDPFVLAFVRWSLVAAILLPLALRHHSKAIAAIIKRNWTFFLALSFLGMGVSGSGVYLGLKMTTATNATLLYSVSPILIILLERIFSGRQSNMREFVGIVLAFLGVAVIVTKGALETLLAFSFNPGDLLITLAALTWAGYSILYRSEHVSHLSSLALFAVIALFGALINLPIAAYQLLSGEALPATSNAWLALAGIVFVSSLGAFTAFQFGVRRLGASTAGLFMYLMTPYGVIMAVLFLGESLQPFHLAGIALVMIGVGAATFPKNLFRRAD